MLDGMRNLQQLNLRNNSLTSVDENTFASLRFMTTLDLAHNSLTKIAKRTFSHQTKLFWLDLSNNQLTGYHNEEKCRFCSIELASIACSVWVPGSAILLSNNCGSLLLRWFFKGNPLICDDDFDWFVRYLVTNRIRTFLPFQPEITCAGPEKYAVQSFLSAFLPGLRSAPAGSGNGGGALETAAAGLPILNTLSQCHRLAVRFATGGQPVASDIEQLIQSIPNFIVNVPGLGDVDISKMRTQTLFAHVARGGQIPGIPKETLDSIVQQYMLKMHEAAAAAQKGQLSKDGSKFLPPLEKLPHDLIRAVIQGENLPGLDEEQTKVIKVLFDCPPLVV
ncbi:leucine Rich repeat-containing domain protein [Cooperia oncophora]